MRSILLGWFVASVLAAVAVAACADDGQASGDSASPGASPSEASQPVTPVDGTDTTGTETTTADADADADTSAGAEPAGEDGAGDPEDATEETDGEADGTVVGEATNETSDVDETDDTGADGSGDGLDGDDGGSEWLATTRRGDSGDDVVALQERLNEIGMGAGPVDGDYGRRTEQAVQAFQRLVRLPPTGEANRVTLNNLADFSYDGPIMTADSDSATVLAVQKRLADGPFDPGTLDGEYGPATRQAVWALEKLAGIPVDGEWGPLDEWAWEQLDENRIGRPVESDGIRWVEIDLSQQLVKVYDPGNPTPVLVSHASSGSGIPWSNEEHSGSSITPTGNFEIQRRIDGWRESSLDIGRLYNPLYFVGGIALHGSLSVPLYPASHGCVRLPMHVAEYLPDELPNGTPVHVMA